MNDLLIGLLCCFIAGIFFGTNYLPVKSVDCGDGFFFSMMMSFGIIIVGFFVTISELTEDGRWGLDDSDWYPMAAIGGASWMIGNLLVPTIIRRIGLGLGLTIWDLSNMLSGWATGAFGLFGVWKESIKKPGLNVAGVLLCSVSLVFFVLAGQADAHKEEKHQADCADLASSCIANVASDEDMEPDELGHSQDSEESMDEEKSDVAKVTASYRSFISGCSLALLAGLLFGYTFDVPTQLMQCGQIEEGKVEAHKAAVCTLRGRFRAVTSRNHSINAMNYVLSHFSGILVTGILAFLIYVAVQGRRTYAPKNLVLPSMMSGAMWGIAQAAWFMANAKMSMTIAFPIISTLPGIVAMLCGLCFFNELSTRASRIFATLGLSLRIPGVVMIALSN